MKPFSFTVNLKQHTPQLHFQYDQDGATLRATELKPKLDAYILTKYQVTNKDYWAANDEEDGKKALNYKLRIATSGKKARAFIVGSFISRKEKEQLDGEGLEYLANTPYFADNPHIKKGAWSEARRALSYDKISVEVFSFYPELVKWVEEALPIVLALNNFGTRQSKGFGSFMIEGTSVDKFEDYLREGMPGKQILCHELGTTDAGRIFKFIDEEYKILKGGTQSFRSQLMLYYQDKHKIDWEKGPIKDHLVKNYSKGNKVELQKDKRLKYIRAFLGVAELYEFPQMGTKVHVACFDKEQSGKKRTLVERFRSPITFKVFQGRIYLLTNKIPDELFGCTFKFSNDRGDVFIDTPSSEVGFNLDDFLLNYTEKESWENVGNN